MGKLYFTSKMFKFHIYLANILSLLDTLIMYYYIVKVVISRLLQYLVSV
jgi:hypothetical protein